MIPPVPPIGGVSSVAGAGLSPKPVSGAGNFGELISNFVENTNKDQQASGQAIDDLVSGKTDNMQDVVMAVANAEMSFQFFMEIRNKVIDAWTELMRMQF
jgi:flagellar hook-basal body complex protein FliE